MNFGEWFIRFKSPRTERRARTALVVSGPQGSGKGVLIKALCGDMNTQECTEQDLNAPFWQVASADTVCVIREAEGDARAAMHLVTNDTRRVDVMGRPPITQPGPWAVIIDTLYPEKFTGSRFVHIRLGDAE